MGDGAQIEVLRGELELGEGDVRRVLRAFPGTLLLDIPRAVAPVLQVTAGRPACLPACQCVRVRVRARARVRVRVRARARARLRPRSLRCRRAEARTHAPSVARRGSEAGACGGGCTRCARRRNCVSELSQWRHVCAVRGRMRLWALRCAGLATALTGIVKLHWNSQTRWRQAPMAAQPAGPGSGGRRYTVQLAAPCGERQRVGGGARRRGRGGGDRGRGPPCNLDRGISGPERGPPRCCGSVAV